MTWDFYSDMIFPNGRLSFVEQWPLMNPYAIVILLASYLLFVLKIGPILMKDRPPVQIKAFLIFYNLLKVINSIVLTYKLIASHYWNYMVTKTFDLFDTVFFVVRKKNNQMTFLHIYHHSFMVVISWSCLKYDPSDHWAFMAVMNCLIHTIMYTYYGIAAMGPRFAKFTWWKKYLTMFQLIQFVLVIVHVMIQTYTSECPMHTSTYWIGISNLALFTCLFAEFYNKRYLSKGATSIGLSCTKQVTE